MVASGFVVRPRRQRRRPERPGALGVAGGAGEVDLAGAIRIEEASDSVRCYTVLDVPKVVPVGLCLARLTEVPGVKRELVHDTFALLRQRQRQAIPRATSELRRRAEPKFKALGTVGRLYQKPVHRVRNAVELEGSWLQSTLCGAATPRFNPVANSGRKDAHGGEPEVRVPQVRRVEIEDADRQSRPRGGRPPLAEERFRATG